MVVSLGYDDDLELEIVRLSNEVAKQKAFVERLLEAVKEINPGREPVDAFLNLHSQITMFTKTFGPKAA